jgi:hypothetical protein
VAYCNTMLQLKVQEAAWFKTKLLPKAYLPALMDTLTTIHEKNVRTVPTFTVGANGFPVCEYVKEMLADKTFLVYLGDAVQACDRAIQDTISKLTRSNAKAEVKKKAKDTVDVIMGDDTPETHTLRDLIKAEVKRSQQKPKGVDSYFFSGEKILTNNSFTATCRQKAFKFQSRNQEVGTFLTSSEEGRQDESGSSQR